MNRIALVNSETLLGTEIKEAFGRRSDLSLDIRLLSSASDELGTVTGGPAGAAFVQELSAQVLSDVDIVVVCPQEGASANLDGYLSDAQTVIQLATSAPLPSGHPVVAGVNLSRAERGSRIVSPHPAVIALAHFLEPLRVSGLQEVFCWSLLPASMHGQRGLDELLDQARAILAFSNDQPQQVFGAQLAFNALPADVAGSELARQLSRVFDDGFNAAMHVLQGGTFHGVVVGASFRLDASKSVDSIRGRVLDSQFVSTPGDPAVAGPVEVAGRGGAMLAELELSDDGVFSLWGAIDNLTTGGAENVVAIVEALVASGR